MLSHKKDDVCDQCGEPTPYYLLTMTYEGQAVCGPCLSTLEEWEDYDYSDNDFED